MVVLCFQGGYAVSSRSFTCPRCGFQFEHAANLPRICPQCGYGEGEKRRQRPRRTAQLPPENPYPPPPAPAPLGRRGRRPFSSYSRPVQVISIIVTMGVIALCCFCGFSFANSFNKTSAEPTSAPVTQNQQATSTPTPVPATATPAPAAATDTPAPSC